MPLSAGAAMAIAGAIEAIMRLALESGATEEQMQERFSHNWDEFKTKNPDYVKSVFDQVYPDSG
jgi:hypothetical protein